MVVVVENKQLLECFPEAEERHPSNVMVGWGCRKRDGMIVDLLFEICQLMRVSEFGPTGECKGAQGIELKT